MSSTRSKGGIDGREGGREGGRERGREGGEGEGREGGRKGRREKGGEGGRGKGGREGGWEGKERYSELLHVLHVPVCTYVCTLQCFPLKQGGEQLFFLKILLRSKG